MAFYDGTYVLPAPVEASPDGLSLIPYSGPPLTVEGELNKLAYNCSIGRNGAGVHYRSEAIESMILGECLVEMLCGVGLVLSAFLPWPALLTRLEALPLFIDMGVATLTVGLPNLMGHPVMLDGVAVTHQAWRLPLELSLLLLTWLLLWRPLARRPLSTRR